jgi:hypothetical protein
MKKLKELWKESRGNFIAWALGIIVVAIWGTIKGWFGIVFNHIFKGQSIINNWWLYFLSLFSIITLFRMIFNRQNNTSKSYSNIDFVAADYFPGRWQMIGENLQSEVVKFTFEIENDNILYDIKTDVQEKEYRYAHSRIDDVVVYDNNVITFTRTVIGSNYIHKDELTVVNKLQEYQGIEYHNYITTHTERVTYKRIR